MKTTGRQPDLTLALLDYQVHSGRWPIPEDVTVEYIERHHPAEPITRDLLARVLTEYIGEFERVVDLSRSLTVGSLLDSPVDLRSWPFAHIDWDRAAADLDAQIGSNTAIVRVQRTHYFTPGLMG